MESTITSKIATNSSKGILSSPFFQIDYWFATPLSASLNHLLVAGGALLSTVLLILFATVIALKMLRDFTPPQQRFCTKIALVFLTLGATGWTFTLARIFGVVFFSARFWWVVWFGFLLISSYWLYKNYQKLPLQQVHYQAYQLKKRYFPKKKKR